MGRVRLPDAPAADTDTDRVRRNAAVVSATTIVVSIANYAFSLLLVRLLAADGYVAYASIQSLLLLLGSGGMAAVPWAVARHVALTRAPGAAGEALGFGLVVSVAQGLMFGAVSFALISPSSGVELGASTAAAAFALSVVVAPLGLLQGQGRLVTISVLRLVETAIRIGLSVVLIVAVAADPLSPITGFIVASVILAAAALVACRAAFPLRRAAGATYRGLLRHSALLGVAQLALAALGTCDTIVIALIQMGAADARDYLVAALLGRVPLFLGTAVAMTYFPQIASAATDSDASLQQARALRLVVVVGAPVALLLATTPAWALDIVAPGQSAQVGSLLPFTAITGFTVATATVLACSRQARGRYRRLFLLLLPIAAVQPVVLAVAGNLGTVSIYAGCAALVGVLALVVVSVDLRSWRPWSLLRLRDGVGIGAVLVLVSVGTQLTWAWWVGAAVAVVLCVRALLGRTDAS